jgi:hypothetical protein
VFCLVGSEKWTGSRQTRTKAERRICYPHAFCPGITGPTTLPDNHFKQQKILPLMQVTPENESAEWQNDWPNQGNEPHIIQKMNILMRLTF